MTIHLAASWSIQPSVVTIESCMACCRAEGGSEAASLRVAEQYMAAFGNIAKQGNTMLIPASTNDPAAFVAQALSVYKSVSQGGIGTSRYCQHVVYCLTSPQSDRLCSEGLQARQLQA